MLLAFSVFLLSASVLFFEIVLIRLLSMSHWQPFVTLAVSVALLGFGISGTVLSRAKHRIFPNRKLFFPLCAGLASLSFRPAAFLAQKLHMEPGLIVREPSQWLSIAALVGILIVPFVFASLALALPLLERETVGKYYGFNLTGSCLGVVLSLWAMTALSPSRLPQGAAILAAVAFVLSLLHYYRFSVPILVLTACILASAWMSPIGPVQFGQYKDISYTLRLPDSEIVLEKWGISGKLQIVTAPSIRSASGLSTNFNDKLPRQAALYRDGDRIGTLILSEREHEDTQYLAWQTASAPFTVPSMGSSVAIVGFDGGEEIARALNSGASHITVIEPDGTLVKVVNESDLFRPWIFQTGVTELISDRARPYFASNRHSFDAVIFHLSRNLASAAAGFAGTSEDYSITVEGLRAALNSIVPKGIISITGWNHAPPTGRWKVLAILKQIPELYDGSFSGRVYLVEGWSTHTFLAMPDTFTDEQVSRLRLFSETRGFKLRDADDFQSPQVETEKGANIISPDDLDLRSPTDIRPYPWHSVRASYLMRLLGKSREAIFPRVEWGFFFLVMALVISVITVLPLLYFSRPGSGTYGYGFGYLLYFVCLGIGYITVEILLIKRAGLIMGPPQLTAGVVIASFLFFSGLGSWTAERMPRNTVKAVPVFVLIAVFAAAAYLLVPHLLFLERGLRIPLLSVSIFPAAFLMGLPFPLGLRAVAGNRESGVPWAWAITGYTSVVGSSLAGVLAVTQGFVALLLLGIVSYLLAGLIFGTTFVNRRS